MDDTIQTQTQMQMQKQDQEVPEISMPEKKSETSEISTSSAAYVKLLWWPTLIAGIFAVAALYNVNQQFLTVLAHGSLLVYIAIMTTKKNETWQQTAIIGGACGAAVATVVALYKLAIFFNLIYIFNLFTQPLFTALVDAVVAGFLAILFQFARSMRHTRLKLTTKRQ